jgi:hypothetical protein
MRIQTPPRIIEFAEETVDGEVTPIIITVDDRRKSKKIRASRSKVSLFFDGSEVAEKAAVDVNTVEV